MAKETPGVKATAVLFVTGFICLVVLGVQVLLAWMFGHSIEAWGANEFVWIGVVAGLLSSIARKID